MSAADVIDLSDYLDSVPADTRTDVVSVPDVGLEAVQGLLNLYLSSVSVRSLWIIRTPPPSKQVDDNVLDQAINRGMHYYNKYNFDLMSNPLAYQARVEQEIQPLAESLGVTAGHWRCYASQPYAGHIFRFLARMFVNGALAHIENVNVFAIKKDGNEISIFFDDCWSREKATAVYNVLATAASPYFSVAAMKPDFFGLMGLSRPETGERRTSLFTPGEL